LVTFTQAGADLDRAVKGAPSVPMLTDAIDAVIGAGTHRDVHHAEIAHPSGAAIAACSVPNTSSGYAQLLDWALKHAPGPRLAACIEGTRRCRLSDTVLAALAGRAQPSGGSRAQVVRHAEIRRLALALRDAAREVKANRAELDTIVSELVPGLTSRPGIGPVSAAQAIVSFSCPGRCRHDAAFARLAGTSPLEASSGQTTRHRLNRGGDRALNKAIHIIATSRMRCDPATIAYVTRRRAEGKTNREIRRCLKRYIARQLYRALTTAMTPPSPEQLTA
jgi:hypothetical protein